MIVGPTAHEQPKLLGDGTVVIATPATWDPLPCLNGIHPHGHERANGLNRQEWLTSDKF
jgi:hypothetical protein